MRELQRQDAAVANAEILTQSGMKDLAVSPLRYWHKWIRPDREPDEPTPAMVFGTALHCAVLEPDEFPNRYACDIDPAEYPLVTIGHLREWIRDKGGNPKGTLKSDVIAQALSMDAFAPIFDVAVERHAKQHEGKEILSLDFWTRCADASQALRDEPHVRDILKSGKAEVQMSAKDTDTGVWLGGRLDWVTATRTLDIKTFTSTRGKSIDRAIADAIYYEAYYRQAFLYTKLRTMNGDSDPDFVIAFVESEPPHEVRLRVLRPKFGSQPNVYWMQANLEVRGFCETFAECLAHFGTEPWRYAQGLNPLADDEMKGLAFA